VVPQTVRQSLDEFQARLRCSAGLQRQPRHHASLLPYPFPGGYGIEALGSIQSSRQRSAFVRGLGSQSLELAITLAWLPVCTSIGGAVFPRNGAIASPCFRIRATTSWREGPPVGGMMSSRQTLASRSRGRVLGRGVALNQHPPHPLQSALFAGNAAARKRRGDVSPHTLTWGGAGGMFSR